MTDMEAARQRGTAGMNRAATRTEKKIDGWVAMAIERVREYAKKAPGVFTIEQARDSFITLPAPCDLRSWGSVTRYAKNRKIIVPVGYQPAASSHGSAKPAYRCGDQA